MNDPLNNSTGRTNNKEANLSRQNTSELLRQDSSDSENTNAQPIARFLQRQKTLPIKKKVDPEITSHLSQVFSASENLIIDNSKYDFVTSEGQNVCKDFFESLEPLMRVFQILPQDRSYRLKFTNNYKLLFPEEGLNFLPEVIDSAQEQISHLWVNCERYVFSYEVLESGKNLMNSFKELIELVKKTHEAPSEEQIVHIKEHLTDFDYLWVNYESLYIQELIIIEEDARRFIIKAIYLESKLSTLEEDGLADTRVYKKLRRKFVKLFCNINSIANLEGKGRDDFQLEILISAEFIQRKGNSEGCALRNLALSIVESFKNIRSLIRNYSSDIESVDPQMMNNPELVSALESFEKSWEKGKHYLLSYKKIAQVSFFSDYLEGLAKKYPVFNTQMQEREAELFMTIPALLVMLYLKDRDKELCRDFCPKIDEEGSKTHSLFVSLKMELTEVKDLSYFLELVELGLIDESSVKHKSNYQELLHILNTLRTLGMEVQRANPSEWNLFLDIIISQ